MPIGIRIQQRLASSAFVITPQTLKNTMTINFFLFYLRCVVTNEVGRGMGLIPRAPVLVGQEKEKVYFLNESPPDTIQLPTTTSREMG
jgi:hypothetical protein